MFYDEDLINGAKLRVWLRPERNSDYFRFTLSLPSSSFLYRRSSEAPFLLGNFGNELPFPCFELTRRFETVGGAVAVSSQVAGHNDRTNTLRQNIA